jgi:hypothetical protein
MLFLFPAAAVAHSTPRERIALDLLLAPGAFVGRSCRLGVGQLIRLTYLLPNGVLSILNHDNFRLYFGFSDYPSYPVQWFEPPSGASGFYSFGASREAAVEIVALKDINIVFTGCYVDDCGRIAAASTPTVRNSQRTCFLSTGLASEVHIQGSAAGASIGLWTPSLAAVYNDSNPIPTTGISAHPFNIVSIGSDPLGSQKYTIEFAGTNQAFAFDAVDSGVGRAIIGTAVRYQFQPVTGEFRYPDMDPDTRVLVFACLTSVAIVGLLVLVYGFLCCIGLFCAKNPGGTSTAAPLYDARADVSERKSDSSSGKDEKKVIPDQWEQPEPASPYDTL